MVENLRYQDKSVSITVDQLVSDEFAFGASYKLDVADLNDQFPTVPVATSGNLSLSANRGVKGILHQSQPARHLQSSVRSFRPGRAGLVRPINQGYAVDLPGDDFAQVNAFIGYRWPRRRAEFNSVAS